MQQLHLSTNAQSFLEPSSVDNLMNENCSCSLNQVIMSGSGAVVLPLNPEMPDHNQVLFEDSDMKLVDDNMLSVKPHRTKCLSEQELAISEKSRSSNNQSSSSSSFMTNSFPEVKQGSSVSLCHGSSSSVFYSLETGMAQGSYQHKPNRDKDAFRQKFVEGQ